MNRTMIMVLAGSVLACGGGGGGDGTTPPPPPPATLDRITVSPTSVSVAAGQTQALTVQGLSASGAAVSGVNFTYVSANTAVATVSDVGRVTGLAAGTTSVTVTGTAGTVSRTANVPVTVTGALPTAVSVIAGASTNDFTPSEVAIARGGIVTWNFPGIEHNVNFQGTTGAPANIGNTGGGGSVARTFNSTGNFGYICSLHSGMAGTVSVP